MTDIDLDRDVNKLFVDRQLLAKILRLDNFRRREPNNASVFILAHAPDVKIIDAGSDGASGNHFADFD